MHLTSADTLASLSLPQRERLAYIEFRLFFLGDVRRQDLIRLRGKPRPSGRGG